MVVRLNALYDFVRTDAQGDLMDAPKISQAVIALISKRVALFERSRPVPFGANGITTSHVNPLIALAGVFADEPMWQEVIDSIAANRILANAIPLDDE